MTLEGSKFFEDNKVLLVSVVGAFFVSQDITQIIWS